MSSSKAISLIVGLAVLLLVGTQSFYTVDQTQVAIVLQLGKPVGGVKAPGLHFKIPFIQVVLPFDARVLEHDARPEEILTLDKKNMLVDNFTKWRIVDPLEFYQTVRTVENAKSRIEDIIYSQLRVSLGRYTLVEVVNQKRPQIMQEVTERASKLISEYGIEIVDVRIKRTDLPSENERAIFGRMQAERQRQAKQYRSEGQEEAAKIRSAADRDRALLVAEGKRKAEVLRGEGEAEATRIFADALKTSPEFYSFAKSLEAYEKSFKNNTRVVLTPNNEFLKYMK
ncbi:protease modulator HflC [Desulfobaculum bizertense]|uniref:Protein HflC n=1 Tax=Desulfobaculum bizertense DSM 18034 TaxID=1121442 RepID=A0A1T4VFX5_9BACT|nr:protease modulator HflC [Desulfobaculum bizertense]UIJ37763.1 protease modulator HflC [Desulfobaculum bizertense]SKA63872.1 protease FtsH subunit HflC [Desulfobaculum bizertense DSM 18034]